MVKHLPLAIERPDIAETWHHRFNGDLTPMDVTTGSGRKVWWECEKGHSWQSTVYNRVKSGCPYCAGQKQENLKGVRFGHLVGVKPARMRGMPAYVCKCDCGQECTVLTSDLRLGRRTQCSRFDHSVIGMRFGRLVAESLDHTGSNGPYIRCRCDCGNEAVVKLGSLKSGAVRSCGCLHSETASKASETGRDAMAPSYVEGTCLSMLHSVPHDDSETGVCGVSVYHGKHGDRYRARICFQGKTRYLGSFETLEEAERARRDAELEFFEPVLRRHS